MKKSKVLQLLLKISVSLGFIAWIILKTNWVEVFSYLRVIRLWQLLIYIAAVLIGMAISCYKWKNLAEVKNIKLPLTEYFQYYLAGTFINNFMPSFIGGDTFKAYQIGKKDKLYAQAASSVMADRITGLLGASLLALAFSLLNLDLVLKNRTLIIVNLAIVGSLALDAVISYIRHYSVWSKISAYFPEKVTKILRELGSYNSDSNVIIRSVMLSFAFNLVGVAFSNYLLFSALGIHIPILDYLSVIFLISIVSSVPISINNIGIKEWSYITFFGILGIGSSVTLTVAILGRLIQMLISFFALPVYLESRK
jgi:glycosyltransferase 2 family protein